VEDELGISVAPAEGQPTRRRADWAALWFAHDASARIVVSRDLRVLMVNLKANVLLESGVALMLRDGFLTSRDRKLASEVAKMVSAATVEPSFHALGGQGASVLAKAVSLDADRDAAVGLTVRDLEAPIEIECADLESMFGVTPGEHLVVVQLLRGRSSRDIADASGKSVLTIRTHVKRAYGKIGVKTRGQLFARLLPYLSIR
jgi:DNA-binding CsgD family transcriptional regulator